MISVKPRRVAAGVALVGSLGLGVEPVAAAELFGSPVLNRITHHNVTYRAAGLRAAAGYALVLLRPAGGRRPRCAAYLAAPRRAAGTEYFRGSIGSGMHCVGDPLGRDRPLRAGSYVLEVCVPADAYGACRSVDSVVRRQVRLQA